MDSGYKKLYAYQAALEVVEGIYALTKGFPKEEVYGLTSQIRRAAVSIPSNIAEGHGKNTSGEYLQALGHARGSAYEVDSQLEIAGRLKFGPEPEIKALQEKLASAIKAVEGLHRSIKNRKD